MKLVKAIAVLLAVMMLTTGLLATASAAPANSSHYQEQLAKYEAMKSNTIWINLNRDFWYELKASKLYGRRITGVAPDGSWILGAWELLDDSTLIANKTESTDGTYFAFAYSFDIIWGTDWPYSGVFYSNPDDPPATIRIRIGGTCRMASIHIEVDGRTVVDESNCSSHSEWRP